MPSATSVSLCSSPFIVHNCRSRAYRTEIGDWKTALWESRAATAVQPHFSPQGQDRGLRRKLNTVKYLLQLRQQTVKEKKQTAFGCSSYQHSKFKTINKKRRTRGASVHLASVYKATSLEALNS